MATQDKISEWMQLKHQIDARYVFGVGQARLMYCPAERMYYVTFCDCDGGVERLSFSDCDRAAEAFDEFFQDAASKS